MSISTTIIFVISISTAIVVASPASKRSVWTGGQISIDRTNKGSCLSLPEVLKEYCGYPTTYLPNSRGQETIEDAQSEFNDFTLLINANPRCSNFLGTFLCFYYFPLSNCDVLSGNNPSNIGPCKETCFAAKTDNCTTLVQTLLPDWPEHLDCDQFQSNSSIPITCSYGENTRRYISSVIFPPPATTTQEPSVSIPEIITEPKGLTTEEPEESTGDTTTESTGDTTTESKGDTTTESKGDTTTESTEKTTALPECPSTCNYRESASGKTFKINQHYTFAIKATVLKKIGANKCKVNVIASYPVQTCTLNSIRDTPEMIGNVTLHVPYEHCPGSPDLCSEIGQTAIVAGTHQTNSDGSVDLLLDCSERPLFGIWKAKYDKKDNLGSWVIAGNSDRRNNCS